MSRALCQDPRVRAPFSFTDSVDSAIATAPPPRRFAAPGGLCPFVQLTMPFLDGYNQI